MLSYVTLSYEILCYVTLSYEILSYVTLHYVNFRIISTNEEELLSAIKLS